MRQTTQNTMQAVAIDRFGGLETLTLQVLPVPKVGPDQVLLRVESAGVGQWDIFEREGMFAEIMETSHCSPMSSALRERARSRPSARASADSGKATKYTG